MKVSDLFEARIGYNPERKIPTGTAGDWMKAIGATSEDIAKARAEVVKSAEYEAVINHGMKDESTPRAVKNGTIIFKMEYYEPDMKLGWVDRKTGEPVPLDVLEKTDYFDKWNKFKFVETGKKKNGGFRVVNLHYNVQPHGKIDFTAPNGYHRWPAPSGKPALVKGNPVASIVKTMKNALADLDRQVAKRMAAAKKRFDKPEVAA